MKHFEKVYSNQPLGKKGNISLPSQEEGIIEYSDSELWDSHLNGDPQAFGNIYSKYANILYNYGCQFSNSSEIVKDSIHDIFLQLNVEPPKTQIRSLKAYLFKSIRREIVRNLKKSYRYQLLDDSSCFELGVSSELKFISNEFQEFKKEALETALNKLPKRQREVIYYYFKEGLSYEEIAYVMDIKLVKSTRKLLYRSIESLRNDVSLKDLFLLPFLLFIRLYSHS